MPLPLPNLDDRRFEDLAAEAQERLLRQLPDLAQISPGDPAFVITDLFAWMTETILYRANLIPERQRRAFLNLLQLPLQSAQPSRTLVCVDGVNGNPLPRLLHSETAFKAGSQIFTSLGELQPTPLVVDVLIKEQLDDTQLEELGITKASLSLQYGENNIAAFRPRHLPVGEGVLSLQTSLDKAFYLLISLPKKIRKERQKITENLAGVIINMGIAPAEDKIANAFPDNDLQSLTSRRLSWELAWRDSENNKLYYLPLEIIEDTSMGARQAGVVRLRLPENANKLQALQEEDYQFAGKGMAPPEVPAHVEADQLMFWIRLRSVDDPELNLGYLSINCVDVIGQAISRDIMLGVGDGNPEQVVQLPNENVDPFSIEIEVEENGRFESWTRLNHLASASADDRVYTLDPANGVVRFGDGVRGKRPLPGYGIRVAYYRHGGGLQSNLPAQSIKKLARSAKGFVVRHEWPAQGGVDAESVSEAEQRLPAFLSHRNRAVTQADFKILAESNPVNSVARAECIPGLLPGSNIELVQRDIPGVISLFVIPPKSPALNAAARPTKGLLRDVFDYLRPRILLGTELYVLSPEFVPIALSVRVQAQDAGMQLSVEQAVEKSLLNYLWALPPGGPNGEGWPMGRSIDVDELRTYAGRTSGVLSISQMTLFYFDTQMSQWVALAKGQDFSLTDYQLPQLSAVQARDDSQSISGRTQPDNDLPLPEGLTPTDDALDATGQTVEAIPVVPDKCF